MVTAALARAKSAVSDIAPPTADAAVVLQRVSVMAPPVPRVPSPIFGTPRRVASLIDSRLHHWMKPSRQAPCCHLATCPRQLHAHVPLSWNSSSRRVIAPLSVAPTPVVMVTSPPVQRCSQRQHHRRHQCYWLHQL